MKNFFLLLLTTGLTTACAAQAGVLDSSFSQDGLQNTILSPGNDQIYSLALLPGVYRLSIEAGGSVRQIPLVHL